MEPLGKRSFLLASRARIEQEVGGTLCKVGEHKGYVSVVFGKKGDRR